MLKGLPQLPYVPVLRKEYTFMKGNYFKILSEQLLPVNVRIEKYILNKISAVSHQGVY